MLVIGITGGYATGKTVVANMLKKLGAKVVDADRIARLVVKPRTLAWQKAVRYFGKGILRRDGFINRKKLARIVFSDSKKRQRLNQIVHPAVIREVKQVIKGGKSKVLVVDAPLLFESGIEGLFDKVIVVSCSADVQFRRAKRRRGGSADEILQRIKSQWPLARKIKQSDFVVDNSGSITETRRRVRKIWDKITSAKERKEVL